MRYRWRALLPLVMLAVAVLVHPSNRAGAELRVPSATLPDIPATEIFLNSREDAPLNGPDTPLMYQFDPSEDGEYLFKSFASKPGQEIDVGARLYQSGYEEPLAASGGDDQIELDVTLKAGRSYFLVLFGAEEDDAGEVALEVMRSSHGRYIGQPIHLTGETTRYAKAIARPRDAHWYTFTAPVSGMYSIRSETAQPTPLDTQGYLLDENGVALQYSDDLLFPGDPNFAIWAELTAGKTYYVRVNAFSNSTGVYRLVLVAPDGSTDAPQSVTLSQASATLPLGQKLTLSASVQPADSNPDIAWASSNYAVASVLPSGDVSAVAPGKATIAAIGYGGVQAVCTVEVPPIPVTELRFSETDVTMSAEGLHALTVELTPDNATPQVLSYVSSDPAVARVNQNGVVAGVAPGEATVTVASPTGLSAAVHISVTQRVPTYRALVMGEQNYLDGRTRVGAVNTAQGVADMLSLLGSEDGQSGYKVTLKLDSTLKDMLEAVASAFEGAREGDVSLFYINCHGRYKDGIAYLELHDGARITVDQLADTLGGIPGDVVVLLDFCQSGGFIARSDEMGSFGNGLSAALNTHNGTRFTTGRFKVITSTSQNQNSFRITTDGNQTEASMATAFGRSLCEAGGWDLLRDRRISMKADLNHDRTITFQELYAYVRNRVIFRMSDTDEHQTVQAYPVGDPLPLFTRQEAGT